MHILELRQKNKFKLLNLQQNSMCNLHAFSSSSLLTTFLEDPSELLANKLHLTNSDFNNDQNIFAYDVDDQIRSFKKNICCSRRRVVVTKPRKDANFK